MKNSRAIILNSINDAQHCVKNNLHMKCQLFSTHSAVDVYLKEKFDVDCHCISSLFTADECLGLKEYAAETTDKLLVLLDGLLSEDLSKGFKRRMDFFVPLYSYIGKHHFSGYLYFQEFLKKISEIGAFDEIAAYDCILNHKFNTDSSLADLFSHSFPDIKAKIIINDFTFQIQENRISVDKFFGYVDRARRKGIVHLAKKAWDFASRFSHAKLYQKGMRCGNQAILITEPLYDLDFLKHEFDGLNVVYYPFEADYPAGEKSPDTSMTDLKNIADFEKLIPCDTGLQKLFLRDIYNDFTGRMKRLLNALRKLDELNERYDFRLGIWGNPPHYNTRAMLFEYLRKQNVPILGAQHGASYGNSLEHWHIDSDFNKCDFYISYGFDQNDLNRLYGDAKITTQILPCGKFSESLISRKKAAKEINLLFILTNSFSIFDGGMLRMAPDKLTRRQTQIMHYLDSLKIKDIYIKPFMYSTYENCSVLPILSRLKHVKVVSSLSVQEFVEEFSPSAIIMDFPSTPLYEVIGLDTEIFLMDDELHPFDSVAFSELEKRVYFSHDTDILIKQVSLYLENSLPKKRDNSFLFHYVVRHNREALILDKIRKIMSLDKK